MDAVFVFRITHYHSSPVDISIIENGRMTLINGATHSKFVVEFARALRTIRHD